MKYTPNLNLKKPEGTDIVDIDDFNLNFDTIDTEVLKRVEKTKKLAISYDLNTLVNTGFYNVENPINAPSGVTDWCYIINIQYSASTNYIAQILIPFSANKMYLRTKSTTWNTWEDVSYKYTHPGTHSATMIRLKDGTDVETKLTEVFQSVVSGKSLVETAISNKGTTVSKQGEVATFKEISSAINKIKTSGIGEHEIVRKSHDGTETPVESPIELEYYYRIFENSNFNDIRVEKVADNTVVDTNKAIVDGETLSINCDLENETAYKVTIPLKCPKKDKLGNTLNGIYQYSFTTKPFVLGEAYLITPLASANSINKIISKVGALGGGEFYFAEGEYLLDEPIIIRHSNITLKGSRNVILKRNADFEYIIDKNTFEVLPLANRNSTSGEQAGIIDIRGKSGVELENIKISNFTIEGNFNSTESSYGICVSYVGKEFINGIDIDKCIIQNNNGYGIQLTSSSNNTITENTIQNNNGRGINLNTSSNNTIMGNIVQNNYSSGICLYFSSNNNIVIGNTSQNSDFSGIELNTSSNNTITGNTSQNNNGSGISLSSSSINTITGNTSQNNNNYGISVSSSNNNTITGNTSQNNSITGIRLTSSCNNNTVTGNTSQNNNKYGILLINSSDKLNIIANIMQHNSSGNYSSDATNVNKQANQELA